MPKRSIEGEVLSNKFAVAFAKQQQQLALFGGDTPTPVESHDEQPLQQDDRVDLKAGDGDDEQFGIGAMVPKEIADGTFTNRVPTSMDKLLENLIGKKAAKAHLASKKGNTTTTKPQKASKPVSVPKEESDEEEGRTSAFKSKRRRPAKPAPAKQEESSDEDEESRASALVAKKRKTAGTASETESAHVVDEGEKTEPDIDLPSRPANNGIDNEDDAEKTTPALRGQKAKPKSYLDEILGERSKKKKKKGKGNEAKTAA